MAGEFHRVTTSDGLELQGFLCPAGPNPARTAVCHVHGLDGNFYENRFLDYAARACNRAGMDFLTGNNRGHDYIADILRPAKADYVQLGGMYERLADGVMDIAAWVDFLCRRGARRIILQGHSHGAIKATYYLAKTGDKRVKALALLSPSDDLGLARQVLGRKFERTLERARRLVRTGRGRELMRPEDFPYPVSADSFYDCLGPRSIAAMFNLSRTDRKSFPELGRIKVPVFCAVGTVREAFPMKPDEFVDGIDNLLLACPSFTGAVIRGAPHNYLGYEEGLALTLESWLREQRRSESRSRRAQNGRGAGSIARPPRLGVDKGPNLRIDTDEERTESW